MEFKDNEAIYLQIAAFVSDQILMGKWPGGQKIPSVRDMAVELEVNPNTVMRSYEFLQGLEIIYNKRGLGLFVAEDGFDKVKAYRKENFVRQNLPELFKNMYLLGISIDEISLQYQHFQAQQNNELNQASNDENKQ
ncbi:MULTISPECIES: GntR family transcriptional regulator [Mucilaginibacter]|jgi:DNA-binding transcriptional regulator YhcF (GntR family)|uniref:GntR family transcriptional regulator n=1 Tax=Mucilaginibacter rubeus TaxID=2027860 RepID=A0AAE6MIB7_9SPHI|nr:MULTISPECIES: GntR family transcriptional regulator [Mucilaginibacter]NVM63008.1 DNA-binding transcriptional regulator YhcF (GntR family) [Mucilaginibacter sp. SG538B]QEM04461.1 GntR family transcriptional regulator [Mucilaginibacter rubeus]QEM17057.1 GntR family transcriptional regulator [Mucilaginibacter gossypii]QTE46445.1 GntR family transcriptional regulator [Mucilaginibacter rubeus]QTE53042.1 GntR family transcriptional regulator [Mucilaginibacter rubeus]